MNIDTEADSLLKKYGSGAAHGPECSVQKSGWRPLIEALSARGIAAPRITQIIKSEKGIRVPENTIQRHKRKVCSCHL